MVEDEQQHYVGYKDRQQISRVWITTIQNLTYAYSIGDLREYKLGIEGLINTLFKPERTVVLSAISKIRKQREQNGELGLLISDYILIQRYIIDVLKEQGYLKYERQGTVEEGSETK